LIKPSLLTGRWASTSKRFCLLLIGCPFSIKCMVE
jgi:hypothetical protein